MARAAGAKPGGRCRIFAYGTLLDPGRQRRLFGRVVPAAPATLSDWRKSRCVGRYFGIRRQAGAVTRGGLLRLSSAELKAADAWEKVPELYLRRRVRVRVGPARTKVTARTTRPAIIPCWVYIPAPAVLRVQPNRRRVSKPGPRRSGAR